GVELPTADGVIPCVRCASKVFLTSPNRKIPYLSEKEHVCPIKTGWTTTQLPIVDKVVVLVIFGLGKRVMSKNVQTRKPVLKLGLQRVIAIVSVVAKIINSLRPAETIEERLAVILRTWSCHWLVGVIRRAITRKHVSSLVSHITRFDRGIVRELMLNGDVPGIKCW